MKLDSRPTRVGVRLAWTGRRAARGTLIMHVLDDYGASTRTLLRRDPRPVRLIITGDEKGDFGVSDGLCPPRTNGICGGAPTQGP